MSEVLSPPATNLDKQQTLNFWDFLFQLNTESVVVYGGMLVFQKYR